MKLSNVEKLLLLMLCDISEKQGVKSDFDYDFIKEAIYSGNTWAIEQKYSGFFCETEVEADVVKFTRNILEMWEDIERSYEKLSPEDKTYIKEKAKPFGTNVKFEGFCGNTEDNYMNVAGFLINKLNQFTRFSEYELNSHCPVVDRYKRMYSAYKPIRDFSSMAFSSLTKENIVNILQEQVHPEHR